MKDEIGPLDDMEDDKGVQECVKDDMFNKTGGGKTRYLEQVEGKIAVLEQI